MVYKKKQKGLYLGGKQNKGMIYLNYKLFKNNLNDKDKLIETVLLNRGIENPEEYLSLDSSCINDYDNLDNMEEAVDCFAKHFENNDCISILVDSDPDGFSSAAMLYSYIKMLEEDYPVRYILHNNNKTHGLVKMEDGDFCIPDGTKLFIVPDAGTNDAEQFNKLIDSGIDCIVLDHHEAEDIAKSNKAIIVNNQMSKNYTDKDFSGAGIAMEFLRALDDYYICDYADKFLDLCAFANISDVMDIRNSQTRYYIEEGIKNIKNKFLLALAKAQEFSTKGIINIHTISWYWTPILNSMIRIGSMEDRDLVFRAFIETDERFPYKKRGSDIEVDEDIYTRAARLCKNIKAKQDKMRDALYNELKDEINPDDKVVVLVVNGADSGIVGLSCMKLCDFASKPTIVLQEYKDGALGGSARNYDGSPVKDFKELVNSVGLFNFAQGHSGAFGCDIDKDKLEDAKKALNEALNHIEYDDTIYVDFIFSPYDLDADFFQTLDKNQWVWGHGVSEPLVAVEGVEVSTDEIAIMGKDKNSISFFADGVKYCKFKLPQDDELLQLANEAIGENIKLNVVGECSINDYGGKRIAQMIINDYEVVDKEEEL
jgi:single-stranded-DNA-specific exonuclease